MAKKTVSVMLNHAVVLGDAANPVTRTSGDVVDVEPELAERLIALAAAKPIEKAPEPDAPEA